MRRARTVALGAALVVVVQLSSAVPAEAAAPPFSDDFESGTLQASTPAPWSKVVGLEAQQAEVRSGSWAAGDTNGGSPAYASKQIGLSSELYYRTWFEITSRSTAMFLLRLRPSSGPAIATVGVTAAGKLYTETIGVGKTSTSTAVGLGSWHELQLHVLVNGASSRVDVWYDGAEVTALSKPDSLGSNKIRYLTLGDNGTGHAFHVAFDEVAADGTFIQAPTAPGCLRAEPIGSNEIDLTWSASSDDVGVTRYTIYRNGTQIGTTPDGVTTAYADTSLAAGTYTYAVDAVDADKSHSLLSEPASATVGSGAPSNPACLQATSVHAARVDLSWLGSVGGSRVAGYTVYRDGTQIGTTADGSTTTFTDTTATGLNGSTTYAYTVDAFDGGGKHSEQSPPLSVSTADPVIAAAGDIACDPAANAFNNLSGTKSACRMKYTSDILLGALSTGDLQSVMTMGDNQYYCGGDQAFSASYDKTWGRGGLKAITHPSPGGHDYRTFSTTGNCPTVPGAGYYKYFGSAAGDPSQGYYSFDVGTWHVISLNAICEGQGVVGCGAGSPQELWLRADLAAHPDGQYPCTLVYWYKSRFSSGTHGTDTSGALDAFWQDIYNAGVEIVMNGHDHDYERFAPQKPDGTADPTYGVREFVVGTGGAGHGKLNDSGVAPNSERRNFNTFGVLELTLHPNGYDYQFVPEAGRTFTDLGSGSCHSAPPQP